MPYNSREPGAPAASGDIPLSVPNIGGNEWHYVKECLDTGWVSSVGAFVERFEREFAAAVDAPFAVALSTGTAALHVALLLAGVGPEDEVVLPALSFIAPANAVRYTGAIPVFLDVEPEYWQLDPAAVRAFLEEGCERRSGILRNRVTGRRVAAILPVDILGHPCDLDPLHDLAVRAGLAIVEDATESLGARYRDRLLGSISALSCFSFNGNKLLTTGGGGMLTTADGEMARRARYLSTQAKDDPVEFVHGAVGFNYRLTNVQAAMGCAQLERLEEFLEVKRRIAARYDEAFRKVPGLVPMPQAPWARSAWWLYTVRVTEETFGRSSRDVMHALDAVGIQTRPLWQPLHRSPAHRDAVTTPCPVAERLQQECLSLPCSTGLTAEEQERVIESVLTG